MRHGALQRRSLGSGLAARSSWVKQGASGALPFGRVDQLTKSRSSTLAASRLARIAAFRLWIGTQ